MPATAIQPELVLPPECNIVDASSSDTIPVKVLLEIDALYRQRAAADTLKKIAPKRFNRLGLAWLPVMHLNYADRHFTVRFSNTLQANRLGKTSDWVIIEFRKNGHLEGQATVVTEFQGARRGSRVVRGRETECSESVKLSIEPLDSSSSVNTD